MKLELCGPQLNAIERGPHDLYQNRWSLGQATLGPDDLEQASEAAKALEEAAKPPGSRSRVAEKARYMFLSYLG